MTVANRAEWETRRRAAGLCRYCSGALDRDASSCTSCKASQGERQRLRRARLRSLGRCVHCGDHRAPGKKFCPRHLTENAKAVRELVGRRRAKGLCTHCARVNLDAGHFARCHSCDDPAVALFRKIRRGR